MDVLSKGIVMRGILIGSRTQYVPLTPPIDGRTLIYLTCRFEAMNRLITATKLRPVVDRVFDFEHLRDAYEYQDSQQHVGKVVVKVSKD